jgi:hypothetical protein
MPYRWWQLPESLSVRWMAYVEMLQEFASELANIINDLTHNVHRLRAWEKTVSQRSNDEKLAATHEFINILGTVALGQPYAIKSRFAYAAAHLCHQANRAKEAGARKDDFPQKETNRLLFSENTSTDLLPPPNLMPGLTEHFLFL